MHNALVNGYKHVIWDWNGTLFDDVELCRQIINKILIQNKLPQLSLRQYREIFTFPVQEYYRAAGLDFNKTSFEILGKQFMDDYESRKFECKLFNPVQKILTVINSLGVSQSILSAYSQDSLEYLVDHYDISDFFTGLAGLDNIYANGKMEIGRKWMKKLNFQKGEVLFIGDTVHDFEVAREIGAECLLIAAGHQDKKRLQNCGVTVLDNLAQLMNGNM